MNKSLSELTINLILSQFTPNAHDLFKIATCAAGFDPQELIQEIFRKRRNFKSRINMGAVDQAMGRICSRSEGR